MIFDDKNHTGTITEAWMIKDIRIDFFMYEVIKSLPFKNFFRPIADGYFSRAEALIGDLDHWRNEMLFPTVRDKIAL